MVIKPLLFIGEKMAGKGKATVSIALEGEQKYTQAIKNINAAQKELRSEMKQVEKTFGTSANGIVALTNKQTVLAKQYEQQTQKIKVYEQALDECAKKEQEAAQKVDKLQEEYEEAQKSLEMMKQTIPASTEAIAAQEEKVAGLSTRLEVAQKDYLAAQNTTNKYKTSLNYANIELQDLDGELKQNKIYLEEAEKSTDGTAKSIDEFGNEVKEAEAETKSFGKTALANLAGQALYAAVEKLATGVKRIAEECIETGSQFEASMSKVEAVSGATGDELDALTEKAREMGATTMFSASEAAEAMNYMAMAGWKTEDMLSGIEGVMNLAAASGEDLATTSDIVTDALTAFGLSAQDAGHFADVLAAASSNANTNVAMMGETFSYCAPVAGALGFSIEDTAEAIGLMANSGIKSSQAGTALRRIMQELSGEVKIHSKTLGDVVIQTTNADGSMRDLSDILADCRTAFSQLSESEKATAANAIVGKNAMSGFLALMNAAPADIDKLSSALDNCNGMAAAMANTMQDNLQGKLKILESALQAVEESAYGVFDNTLKNGVDSATEALTRLNDSIKDGDMNVALEHLNESFDDLMDDVIGGIEEHLPQIINGLATLIDNADEICAAVVALVEAWGTYKVATEGAKMATELLNAAMSTNLVMALAAAVLLLSNAALTYMKNVVKEGEEQLKANRQTTESIKKTRELRQAVQESSDEFKKNAEEISATASTCQGLADRLTELNSKWLDGSGREGFTQGIAKQKSIIAELNAAYPSLNLSIDENNGRLNMSTEALYANIEAMKQQAQAAAYQERLTQIAKEKLELDIQREKLLPELEEKENALTEAKSNHAAAEEKLTEAQKEGTAYWENTAATVDEARDAYLAAGHAVAETKGEVAALDQGIEDLSEEEQILTEKMAAATQATSANGEAASGAATGVNALKLSEEELEEFVENVNKSIDSQINLLEEHQAVTEVSKETLKKNLDEQTGALEQWANDFEELAAKGIDDGLLKQLAEMGPAAEGYIQGLLKMSEEELSAYSEKFAEATKLKTETATEIANSYLDAGTEWGEAAGEGTVTGMENKQGDVADAAEKTIEEAKDTAEEKAEEFKDTGEKAMDSTKDGIESNAGNVTKAVEKVGQSAVKTAENSMGKSKFVPIGENIPRGMAEGVKKGQDELVTAVKAMAKEAVAAAEKELVIKSPSKKFEQIGAYTSEGFLVGFNSNTQAIMESVRSAMNETALAAASPVTTPSGLDTTGVTNAISKAIENGMSQITFNLNVGVGRDSIVEAVVGDNNIFKKQTGASRYV